MTRMLRLLRFLFALVAVGLSCGLVGAGFTVILAGVEHLAFGFTTGSFAEAISTVSARHRFLAVAATGFVVAILWYVLRRYGPAIPSPSEIYAGRRVSGSWMAADTTLQVINVAGGGSIGREGAPRQLGALYGAKMASYLKMDEEACRLLIACGAGAGLAAIYNVPLGGTFFAIEVMMGWAVLKKGTSAVLQIVASTFFVALIATVVARLTVPDRPTYSVDWQAITGRIWLLALIMGPLAGSLGYGFGVLMNRLRSQAPKGRAILWTMPLCYLLLAMLSIPLPLVLGNGHAMAQNLFGENLPLTMAAVLILAKPIATLLTVRAGATGGNLTPSLATGAAVGITLAELCANLWPVSPSAAAILGAAAFLAGATRAPLTAGVLAIEFTGAGIALWGPAALTIAGSWLATFLLGKRRGA